ncbi:MAG: MoxR family ATPase [Gorillibacterium sp.]|nr:MoxR family ATPase [Gorillibacterium sp.]
MSNLSHSLLWDQPESMIEKVISNVEKIIVGKRDSVELCVLAILSGGHVLIEDVPGTGKTVLVKALAQTLDCSFNRIQFTPDLLPSDVTGITIFHPQLQTFQFREGPLFANVLLADELNRTPPKTQAALLEAMEEGKMTIDGKTYALPEPFLLLATQNPVEYEGTYSLPEALLDRFLLRIRMGYPRMTDEIDMLSRQGEHNPLDRIKPVIFKEELQGLQKQVRTVHLDDCLKDYIVRLAAETRTNRELILGASPRASVALMRAAQARALMSGRGYCVPDDIKRLVIPVFAHRLLLKAEAHMAGRTADEVAREIATRVPVPGASRAFG